MASEPRSNKMESNGYVSLSKIKVKPFNLIFYRLLTLIFGRYVSNLSAAHLTTLGRGLVTANIIFQKLIGLNRDSPFMVNFTSRVALPKGIEIEDHPDSSSVYLSFAASGGCYITGHSGVVFGRGTIFAPGVKIVSANHDRKDLKNSIASERTEIGKYVWIGANVVILPGISIGDQSILAAGSVVTRDVPPGETWGGVPAKRLKQRRDESHRQVAEGV